MKFDLEKWKVPFAALVVSLVFFYVILGLSGALTALGVVLLFVMPMYYILGNFGLDEDERMVFAFFSGVGVLPSLVFWMAIYISFKVSIVIAVLILLAVGFVLNRRKKKKEG